MSVHNQCSTVKLQGTELKLASSYFQSDRDDFHMTARTVETSPFQIAISLEIYKIFAQFLLQLQVESPYLLTIEQFIIYRSRKILENHDEFVLKIEKLKMKTSLFLCITYF